MRMHLVLCGQGEFAIITPLCDGDTTSSRERYGESFVRTRWVPTKPEVLNHEQIKIIKLLHERALQKACSVSVGVVPLEIPFYSLPGRSQGFNLHDNCAITRAKLRSSAAQGQSIKNNALFGNNYPTHTHTRAISFTKSGKLRFTTLSRGIPIFLHYLSLYRCSRYELATESSFHDVGKAENVVSSLFRTLSTICVRLSVVISDLTTTLCFPRIFRSF